MRKTLTSLSLIGMMLMATAWFTSYWGPHWSSSDWRTHILTEKGIFIFSRTDVPVTDREMSWRTWAQMPGYLNFDRVTSCWLPHIGRGRSSRWAYLPMWIPFLAFSILPTYSFIALRRARERLATRLCVGCGYDLRESPERCPECGSSADAKKQAFLIREPSRLLSATKAWVLLLAALSVPCVVLSNLHFVRSDQPNPDVFQVLPGEILVARKDGAIGVVQLPDNVLSRTPRFRAAYWASAVTVTTNPPDVVTEGSLAEPDATDIAVGPWGFSWSWGGWIYRSDSSFAVEVVNANTIEEFRQTVPQSQQPRPDIETTDKP